MAPHDSDDDVDDLDDILNNFKPTNTTTKSNDASSSSAAPSVTKPAQSVAPHTAPDDLTDDAFARELAQGMETLMRDLGSSLEPGVTSGDAAEQQKAMQTAWEALFQESMDAAAAAENTGATGPTAPVPGAKVGGDSFQKSIRETMERMKSSEQNMKDSTASGTDPGQDDIAALLAALQGNGESSEGDDAELGSFLESMMDQLMSKEVLYEPLKELYDKFPEYLASHPSDASTPSTPPLTSADGTKLTPIPAEDHVRYLSQQRLITTVITKFDDPNYDEDAKTPEAEKARKEIVDLMSELQLLGTPPDELMGPLPSGLGLGGEGMPEGCCIT